MNENVTAFPTPENTKVGFTEINQLQLSVENLFSQTADPLRQLNTKESIQAVKNETQLISDKIVTAISEIDGIRPGMPSVDEFSAQIWAILTTPLEYGENRAALSYYGTEEAFAKLVNMYKSLNAQLQKNALDSL